MARKATTALDSKTARLRLAPRKNSYFAQVARGLCLGYNRRAQAAGMWTRRELLADGHLRSFHPKAELAPRLDAQRLEPELVFDR